MCGDWADWEIFEMLSKIFSNLHFQYFYNRCTICTVTDEDESVFYGFESVADAVFVRTTMIFIS